MSGIGYNSKIVIYNSTGGEIGNPRKWYGVEMNNVRIELQERVTASTQGKTGSSTCTVKIHDDDLPAQYYPREKWQKNPEAGVTFDEETIFAVSALQGVVNQELPSGNISDNDYKGGFLAYLRQNFGLVYKAVSAQHYQLIPHWEVNGA